MTTESINNVIVLRAVLQYTRARADVKSHINDSVYVYSQCKLHVGKGQEEFGIVPPSVIPETR